MVEPESPGEKHGDVPLVVSTSRYPAKAKPVRFETTGASVLPTLPFGFNPEDTMGMLGIGV